MKRAYLIVVASTLGLMGLLLVLAPEQYAAGLGALLTAPSLLNVTRSFGGFYLGFAAFLFLALNQKPLTNAGVISGVTAMLGILAGRLASLGLDGPFHPRLWVSMSVELVLAAWGLFIVWRTAPVARAEAKQNLEP